MTEKPMYAQVRAHDLDQSGLYRPALLRKLRFGEILNVAQTNVVTEGIENAVCYEIPYFGPRGEDLKYSRWKLFPTTDDELGIKYYQNQKTIPRLYLPQLVDWARVCADPSIRIIITEGEKKAACATGLKLPCISVGGVWSFKARKWHMKHAIPDFDWFEWKGRDVEICYDGDMYTNENVAKALDALTAMLTKRGARVYVRHLPTQDGISKLDDFLVTKGVSAYQRLDCVEAPNSELMSQLNDDLVYIKDTQTYFSTHDRILYGDVGRLKRNYGHMKITADTGKQVSAIDEWVQWPFMRKADKMTYAPGEEMFANGMINDWPGWGVEARRGRVDQFLDVIKGVEGWEWLLKWLAYPIQNPGVKMFSAVLLWSVEQGTGKSFIGDVMRDIYGKNSKVITSKELHDDSMVWLRSKQFILGEEVSQRRSVADTGLLKHIITGDTVTINEKYVPQFDLPNCANLMFTSNKNDALILDKEDRRFFVGSLTRTRTLKFWQELDRWRKRDGGPSAFRHYLENRVDCSKFNPLAPPPDTSDKLLMQDAGLTSLQQWIRELLEDPEGTIAEKFDGATARLTMKRDVFSVQNVMSWLPEDLERSANRVMVGNALVMLGAVRNKSPVRLSDGKQVRLVAIKNTEHWRDRVGRNKEWSENYERNQTKRKRGSKITPIGKKRGRK